MADVAAWAQLLPESVGTICVCTVYWHHFLAPFFGTIFWYRFLAPFFGTVVWHRFLAPSYVVKFANIWHAIKDGCSHILTIVPNTTQFEGARP